MIGEDVAKFEDGVETGTLFEQALGLIRNEFEPRTVEAFWRFAVNGEEARMIAADLGVTVNTIRKHKSRVLAKLRQEFGDLIR